MSRKHTNLIGALMIGLCIFLVMPYQLMLAGANDFAHFYIGGMLYGTPDIHSPELNQQKQLELTGHHMAHSYFIRPTFYGFLMKPFSWLPYFQAYLVFQAISAFCIVLFLRTFATSHKDLWTIAAMSPPLIANMLLGQDVSLLLGFSTTAVILARKGRDFAAGLVLSLCAIKFHLFLLVPAAVLFHRRWNIFWGGATGGVVLALLGLGSGGIAAYEALFKLLSNPANHPGPDIMPNLRGFVFAVAGNNTSLLVVCWLATAAAVCYLAKRAESFEIALGFCFLGGLLVNFHSYMQDCLLILLALAMLTERYESKLVIRLLVAAALPFPYFFLLAGPPYNAVFHSMVIASIVAAVRWYAVKPSPSMAEASSPA